MMKKIYALILSIAAVILMPLGTSAISGADFNPARIIDDLVFFNKNSMTVQQIQDFLNSKVPICDSNHAGFSGGTGTLYNPPFICLKDFYENPDAPYTVNFTYKNTSGVDTAGSRTFYENNSYRYTSLTPVYKNGDYTQGYSLKGTMTNIAGVKPAGAISAAQIIYNAAQTYNINPQVLLVTLQKEQGLVTDTWPAAWQYQAAMGYGCPDTAPCSAGYAGFSRQVFSAAYQFRLYTDNPDSYNFKGGTTRYVQYNPTASCGGTNVAIYNQATANLYNYTPYQPNAGALANTSDSSAGGSATCGAYGNRNFFWYFNKWFGSTLRTLVMEPTYGVYLIENGMKRGFTSELTFLSYGYKWSDVTLISKSEISNIPSGTDMPYNQNYRNGKLVKTAGSTGVYLVYNGTKRGFQNEETFFSQGYKWSDLTTISNIEMSLIPSGTDMPYNQNYRNGKLVKTAGSTGVYLVYNGTKRGFQNEETFFSQGYKWSDLTTISNIEMSLIPSGTDMPYNQNYRNGKLFKTAGSTGVYYVDNGLKRGFQTENIFLSYGYRWADIVVISKVELSMIPSGLDMPLKTSNP